MVLAWCCSEGMEECCCNMRKMTQVSEQTEVASSSHPVAARSSGVHQHQEDDTASDADSDDLALSRVSVSPSVPSFK